MPDEEVFIQKCSSLLERQSFLFLIHIPQIALKDFRTLSFLMNCSIHTRHWLFVCFHEEISLFMKLILLKRQMEALMSLMIVYQDKLGKGFRGRQGPLMSVLLPTPLTSVYSIWIPVPGNLSTQCIACQNSHQVFCCVT